MGKKQGVTARKRKTIMRSIEREISSISESAKEKYSLADAKLFMADERLIEASILREDAKKSVEIASSALASLRAHSLLLMEEAEKLSSEIERASKEAFRVGGLDAHGIACKVSDLKYQVESLSAELERERRERKAASAALADDGHVPDFLRKALSRIEKSGGRVPPEDLAHLTVRVLKWATDAIDKEKMFGRPEPPEDGAQDAPVDVDMADEVQEGDA